MSDKPSSPPLPEIPAVLALAGPLRPLASAAHPLHETARSEIAARAGRLLMVLGIPGKLAVALEDGEAGTTPGPLLALTVNAQLCSPGGAVVTGLWDRVVENGGNSPANLLVQVDDLKETCLEILKDQPEVLLASAQAEAVGRELPRPRRRKGESLPDWPPDTAVLLPALRVPASLGISIADREQLAKIIGANPALWDAPEDLGELLAGGLSAPLITILLPEGRLRELTLTWQEKGPEAFSQRRLALAKDLGLSLPPFTFQTSPELTADEYAFQIQHIPGRPLSGLTLDNLLDELEAEIRRRLPRLVVRPRVEAQLQLVDTALSDMVEDQIPMPRLVRELRLRAQMDGSLRRLPLILEELLDAPYAATGALGSLALS